MTYASFWKRVAAYTTDAIIYYSWGILCRGFLGLFANEFSKDINGKLSIFYSILSLGFYLLYFVYAESSPAQATWGKRLFGLKVTDLEGKRISFARSLGRNLSMWISALTLGVGYLMCLWTKRKQCLHDKMAQCIVVNDTVKISKSRFISALLLLVILGLNLTMYVVRHQKHETMPLIVSASLQGKTKLVSELIQEGIDVNITIEKGATALMAAVQNNHIDTVTALLKAGANVNIQTTDHHTALELAVKNHNASMSQLLLNAGANPNIMDSKGFPILHSASQNNDVDIINELLNAGANVNATGPQNFTALHLASQQGNTEAMEFLLNAQADPNVTTTAKWTPLMSASYFGNTEEVKLLLQAGAQINATDDDNRTALLLASQQGYLDTVKALLQAGADVNIKDAYGQTPLVIAEGTKHFDVATALREAGAK